MSGGVAALLTLVLVGLAAVSLSSFVNRKGVRAANSARRLLELQANALPSHDIHGFLNECGLAGENVEAGHMLLQFLAGLLKVSPDKLADDYSLRQLYSSSKLVASGNGQPISSCEPFAYDLVDGIAKLSDKKLWERRWKDSPGLPCGEEEMADFIMQMTIPDVLRFFAPLMKRESKKS